ncbi:MAG: hypothetical protein K0Q48_3224 [Bacillota bacterium]|jgi:hypothetical protein|nr:hypothetical protein [Bacillota bacterium]
MKVLTRSGELELPASIASFFQASVEYDEELLAGCFAEEAILQDEGMEYRGPAEISRHIIKANRDAAVTKELIDFKEKEGVPVATAMLSGDFEGSPLPLDFHFILSGDKIRSLDITLSEPEL